MFNRCRLSELVAGFGQEMNGLKVDFRSGQAGGGWGGNCRGTAACVPHGEGLQALVGLLDVLLLPLMVRTKRFRWLQLVMQAASLSSAAAVQGCPDDWHGNTVPHGALAMLPTHARCFL